MTTASAPGDETDLIVVLGPTASGKTRLAIELARELGSEILSADSRQVYRGLDIGAGKDLLEYGDVPCHLVDIADPADEFSLFDYVRHFSVAFDMLRERGVVPIMAGGTGLYIDAIVSGYELTQAPIDRNLRDELRDWSMDRLVERLRDSRSSLHNVTDTEDRDRVIRAIEIAEASARGGGLEPIQVSVHPLVIGIRLPRDLLRKRITARLKARLEGGMLEEVRGLLEGGLSPERLDMLGLEYRFVARYLAGALNYNDMYQKLNSAIHAYARRQETWFRRMERRGTRIHWLDGQGELLPVARRLVAQITR